MELEAEIEALAPRLLRYCLGRLGDRALAEEVSQEALTALVDCTWSLDQAGDLGVLRIDWSD